MSHSTSSPEHFDRRLDGQVCIVTGGASGIGRAIARRFARHGATVVVADVSQTVLEGGETTVDVIASEGGMAHYVETDVSDDAAVTQLVAFTASKFRRLDVMVNNACIRHARRLTDLTLDQWERVLAVNLTGVFLCCKAAVRWPARNHAMKSGDV